MIKENIYDDFICLADKCKMTCCNGWAIKVEQQDFDKWKNNEETHYLCEQVNKRKDDGFNMKLLSYKGCVMLDECGLCEIVKKHGDEYLSKTCAEFPRKHNTVREFIDEESEGEVILDEYSMSGACPGVLKLLAKSDAKTVDIPEKCRDKKDFPFEYQIRNMIIDIFQETEYDILSKFELSFSFLHECIECEWEEDVYNIIEIYRIKENQIDKLQSLKDIEIDEAQSLMELAQTFLDMTEYYKEEDMYRPYLLEASEYCEKIEEDFDNIFEKWKCFKKDYEKKDDYMSKIVAGEIFSDCISDDVGEIIESLQIIFLEYLMTRMSVFFEDQLDYVVDSEKIESFVALYIRMLGHNLAGMCEYWEENFEDSILDMDYIVLLCN